jgi:hypothetical protein
MPMEPAPAVPMYHINTAIRCTHCLGPPRPSNSSWEPPQHSLAVELAYKSFGGWLEQQLEVAANPTSDPGDRTTNVPSSFRKLVSELRSRGVIARPADKNLGTCVLPLSWYRQMLWTHLSDVST